MKLAINYIVKGTSYRIVINAEKLNEKLDNILDNILKEICEKFDGKVERYRVSKIMEEHHIDTGSTTTDATLHSSDNSNFIIKTVLGSVTDGSLNSFSKEEKIIDMSYPCSARTFSEAGG